MVDVMLFSAPQCYAGLKWFKIWQDGYDSTTHQWGSDHLYINKGNVTFTIPSCITAGDYLLRVESIGASHAEDPRQILSL